MVDPFLVEHNFSGDELLQLLLNYQFSEPIYHADCFGHLQVENALDNNPYHLSILIEQLDLMQLWPDFTLRLVNQPDSWLTDFSSRLKMHKGERVILCLVQLTDFFSTEEARLSHLLSASEWPWLDGTVAMIDTVIRQLMQSQLDLQQKVDICVEWEQQIIQQTLDSLSTIRKAMLKV